MISVTPIYASLIALLFVVLSARVIMRRRSKLVAMGDGGDKDLLRAMRAHANCAEYAPFALLLLVMAEWQGAAHWYLHLLGLTLLVGRILHAYGFGRADPILILRQTGMLMTFAVILLAALSNLGLAL
ncbi:MAPEG family protein [Ruegeria sp. 2012CJ41-6]|uniref:MAPEG family protein n=1 Tax=Ruegeria spongiae TaxID=2942209 RepID=A0ABT0Q656_9RHOB|nr:MAPEG family protein [Ruegeria spongiae]MCL6285366.1 MAPEG family protein [Ruegeria spongiae]